MQFKGRDVNEVFPVAWHRMMSSDMVAERMSRNGLVREARYPVTTIFTDPKRRVLFHPVRDANPFFHLFEAIWMLAGRDDVEFLAKFNPRMRDFSDDGVTITGSAYGKKWNEVLEVVIDMLRKDRSTRRAYISLSERNECGLDTKDTPCNVGISFHVRDGYLDMTVFNRSNDMIWGAYGANYVHFGFFQEYVAALTELEVGYLAQVSSNFHIYPDFDVCKKLVGNVDPMPINPYADGLMQDSHMPIIDWREQDWTLAHNRWLEEAAMFIDGYTGPMYALRDYAWHYSFFSSVAVPMFDAWHAWKEKDIALAREQIKRVRMLDWQRAGYEWIERRYAKSLEKAK